MLRENLTVWHDADIVHVLRASIWMMRVDLCDILRAVVSFRHVADVDLCLILGFILILPVETHCARHVKGASRWNSPAHLKLTIHKLTCLLINISLFGLLHSLARIHHQMLVIEYRVAFTLLILCCHL